MLLKSSVCCFVPVQPSLLPGDPDAAFGNGEDGPQDSDVDVDGRLELDENGNVVCGNYSKVGLLS